MSTIHVTEPGEFVIVKLLSVELVVMVWLKKAVAEFSGLAETAIFTPFGGILDLILTFKVKFGPGKGGST